MNLSQWIYIYRIDKDNNLYCERSVSRTSQGLRLAKARVKQIEANGQEAFYTIGTLADEPAYEFTPH